MALAGAEAKHACRNVTESWKRLKIMEAKPVASVPAKHTVTMIT